MHSRVTRGALGRMTRTRTVLAVAVTVCTGVAATCFGLGAADAQSSADDFYVPPAEFSAEPGAVIRTAPMQVMVAAPGSDAQWPIPAQRVLYSSRTEHNEPVAVSGTFIDSTRPWQGAGPRPTVVIGPGTSGQGDQCAQSKAFSTGLYADLNNLSLSANQEAPSAATWNMLGARVFVTDYIGLGTPGVHTYTNRLEQAHAVLDATRAAHTLSGSGAETPVAFWGYSQGGGAVAAAAELKSRYAPELNLRGTWAGGPTADLAEVVDTIDGNLISAVIGFSLNGFLERYPHLRGELDGRINQAGLGLLDDLSQSCIADVILHHPFTRTTDFTVDGRPILDHLEEVPAVAEVVGAQRVGTMRPYSPVLITSGRNDDTVPYPQARQLADDWCAQGTAVTFRTNELPPILPGAVLPNHFGPELIDAYGPDNAIGYLLDRFADKPLSGCSYT